MEIENVYTLIHDLKHDTSIQTSDYIILQPHQLVPKYYMLSSLDRHTGILNYSTGSGKSLSGLFLILERIYLAKINQIMSGVHVPKAIILGEWSTVDAFKKEMSRKMFKLVDQKLLQQLDEAKTASEKDAINQHIMNSLGKYVNFYGYQMLFNRLFPSYAKQNVQDVNLLFKYFNKGSLLVNRDYLNNLKGNIIIVDEMQRLYSQSGMNTYGFTMTYLARMSRELNLKIVYMSGTPFNSSLSELSSILNIIDDNPSAPIYGNDLFTSETILGDQLIYKLHPSTMKMALEMLKPRLIHYSKSTVKKEYVEKTIKSLKIPIFGDADKCLYLSNEKNPRYPTEIKIGNTIISDSMILYQLQASGLQLKGLKSSIEDDYEDEDGHMSIHDAVLPPKNEWSKHGISKDKDGLLTGNFLDRKSIGKYSAIGAFLIDLCTFNASHNEKTVLYHHRLMNFGLNQYAKILEHNGFVRRGTPVKPNSICRLCLSTLKNHKKTCERFAPIYYELLSGSQSSKDRAYIVNRVYNSPNNLYGDLISVLLISDVANVGVSLMATNNLVIIPRVSNVSKIDQICARIIRMDSHIALPEDKRYAKLYLLGATDAISKTSSSYKYYKLRDINNSLINEFMEKAIPQSIGETLLKRPSSLKLTPSERLLTSEMYFDDGARALESVGDNLLSSIRTNMWRLSTLINRIKSHDFSISYLDLSIFPDSFISYYITNNPNITCFNFPQVTNDTEKIYVRNSLVNDDDDFSYNSLMFKDIMMDYHTAIKGYMHNIEKLPSMHKKRLFFIRMMDILSVLNDFTVLADWPYLWEHYVFDIASEYYKDDEKDFIKNHSYKNRNPKKVEGLYYGNQIILKNGTTKGISFSFVKSVGHQTFNKIFIITAYTGLHVLIYGINDETEEVTDKRKISKGIDCWTYNNTELSKYYKFKKNNTVEFCAELIGYLCEEQIRSNQKFIVTPFEKDASL